MQEGGAAAEVAQDEKRLFNRMVFVGGEEDVVEREKEPVHQSAKRPDDVEQNQKYQSFFCEAGGCVVGCEE